MGWGLGVEETQQRDPSAEAEACPRTLPGSRDHMWPVPAAEGQVWSPHYTTCGAEEGGPGTSHCGTAAEGPSRASVCGGRMSACGGSASVCRTRASACGDRASVCGHRVPRRLLRAPRPGFRGRTCSLPSQQLSF